MHSDHYGILGVSRGATPEEIKRAYRSKAKLCHPDVNSSPESNQLFILLNEAYETLSDEQKKFLYDLKFKYSIKDNYYKYGNSRANQYEQKRSANPASFHYDWESFNKLRQPKKRTITKGNKIVFTLFSLSLMFIGFLIIMVTAMFIYIHLWPKIFAVIAIPGILIVEECWCAITDQKSIFKRIKKWLITTLE